MPGRITVVGLGPAGAELITAETAAAVAAHRRRYVRTARHAAVAAVGDAVSFDDVYESEPSFVSVYATICDRLLDAAAEGDLLYAVPGSPRVLERTVELLAQRCGAGGVELRILPAVSFLDLSWTRLGIDPVESGVRLVDGQEFAARAAGQCGPLLVANCYGTGVLSEMKLAVDEGPESVTVLQRLGHPDETITEVAWADLDRAVEPDHLTSVYVAALAEPVASEIVRFDELVRTLRERCPWDREQTHTSLRRHLLEEAYEALEALDQRAGLDDDEADDDLDEHLCEELGDLLYQVWFQARLASERGAFTMSDVARNVHDKLVSRHPHVFGDVEAADADAVRSNWDVIKQVEKGRESTMDGIPHSLPALLRAVKVLKRAVAAELAPRSEPGGVLDEVERVLSGLRGEPGERRLGELLLAVVELGRSMSIDPEDALRAATRRAEDEYRQAERAGRGDLGRG